MIISVRRTDYLEKCTIGQLYVDWVWKCYTLERPPHPITGKGCIPPGDYPVIIDFSNRFQRDMPHILQVPGYQGIRIHPGNSDQDTEGCILVGLEWNGGDFIGQSKFAFDQIFSIIQNSNNAVELDIS